ncbi:MAG TPA: S9 family peptidase [Solirubrobacteraceae bacterium]|nr:S9 family peptidase [Solirubrobacteraceae bacterium]
MAKRRFRADDVFRLRTASDPDLSPDGRRVAFAVTDADEEADRLCSSIWVAPVDGSAPARRFTEGPADTSPRFSPDGRWLAYISVTDERPEHAHVRLAPLDGGMPARLGDLPGPVTQLAWSPDSCQIVVVCRVGAVERGESASPRQRNAPVVPRGLAAKLDGVGWQEGRRHLFLVDVAGGSAKQITRGEYDHDDPAFSPDGASIAFASDRHPRRDDRQFRGDIWVTPAGGGRPQRLTIGKGIGEFPSFSPDGRLIAFAGTDSDEWNADTYVFAVPADGSAPPERLAPDLDRPTVLFAGLPAPVSWIGNRELLMLVSDRGSVKLHRVRVGERRSREVLGGDILIDGVAARPGRRAVAYTASWPDRPSEVYATTVSGAEPTALTGLNTDFLSEVELGRVNRSTVVRPDGIEVEYFTILPAGGAHGLPVHVDIHGGPHAAWPSGRWLAFHQAIAAAGYVVVLPNPRGSTSYGQEFTRACTGDWGGADCQDILACCDDLIQRGIADGGRMFVSGGSYGGFMTGWLVGHTDRFRAATAVAAVIDQTSMALTTEIPEFATFNLGGTPWARRAEYELRSPLSYLPAVKTPVLIVHWEGDIRVPIGQGEELYTGLRLLGKKTEFVRYPGGFHITRTPSQAVDWTNRMLAWNEQHDTRPKRRTRGD